MATPQITSSKYLTEKFLNEQIYRFTEELSLNRHLNVLDLGCGQKPYKSFFVHPQLYIGVDLRSKSADVIARAENLPFRNSCFDVVLCTQVLEHVEEPKKVLEEIKQVLRIKGLLILSTHGFWMEAHEPTDYWRWTLQGLEKLMKSAGFNIIKTSSMEPTSSTFQFLLLWIPTSLFSALVNFAALTLKELLKNKGPRVHTVHIVKAVRG
jgi:SAM-dependent methyltransferase